MLRASLAGLQRQLLLSRATIGVPRPATSSGLVAGLHGRGAIGTPRGAVSLMHVAPPPRAAPFAAIAGQVMVLGGASCLLLASSSQPAAHQAGADGRFKDAGELAPLLCALADGDEAKYRKEVKRLQLELAAGMESPKAADLVTEEKWRAGVQELFALNRVKLTKLAARLHIAHDEEGLKELSQIWPQYEALQVQVEGLYGKVLAPLAQTDCPPRLLVNLLGFVASLPEDDFDAATVAGVGKCLESALRLAHVEVKPVIRDLARLKALKEKVGRK